MLGTADEFPIVCTTYRLTEHFHYWTKNNPYNVQLQPEFFVEMPEELAREKGIANRDMVRVTSARGSIEGRAMVTRRIKPMQVAGRPSTRSDSRSTGASSDAASSEARWPTW